MAGSYYNGKSINQMKGVMVRPTSGLNEYNSALELNDNVLSACLDVFPQKNESIKFQKTTANVNLSTAITGTGRIVYAIADKIPTDSTNLTFEDHVVGVLFNNNASVDHYLDSLIDVNVTDASSTTISISSYNLKYEYPQSMCLFFTETTRYVVYTNSYVQKLFVYNYTTLETVDLPFYPKKICSHANRVFAMDTGNKIWWCRAGDFRTWYGVIVDDDRIVVSTDMVNSTYTIAAQPPVPMFLGVTITKTSTIDTMGTITFVGTSTLGVAQTEVVIPIDGIVYTNHAFKSITSITGAGWSGVAGTDKIKIGTSVVANGYATEDAGMWTLEQERMLMGMVVLSNKLYIWSDTCIYIFHGTGYDTFSLQKIVSDIGVNCASGESVFYDLIAVSNNKAYFYYSGDIYEFDGNNYPKIISRPVVMNGQNVNGMTCGIVPTSTDDLWALTCDKDYLYYYDTYHVVTAGEAASDTYSYLYYYRFDIKERTWWYHTGNSFTLSAAADSIEQFMLPQPDREGMYNLYARIDASATPVWAYRVLTNLGLNTEDSPYIITKAYSNSPSETGTLTDLIIMFKGSSSSAVADFTISYSLTEGDDDFISLWSYDGYIFNGDIETITIPVQKSYIARTHHYRLKVEISPSTDSSYVYLYNIERRYRVMGRSR